MCFANYSVLFCKYLYLCIIVCLATSAIKSYGANLNFGNTKQEQDFDFFDF